MIGLSDLPVDDCICNEDAATRAGRFSNDEVMRNAATCCSAIKTKMNFTTSMILLKVCIALMRKLVFYLCK